MHYPELTLDRVTPAHVDTYLQVLQQTLAMLPELANDWDEMEEAEQFHFRLEFTRVFGLRRLLGSAYRAGKLSATQTEQLANWDRDLLAQAAALEATYATALRQLVHDLFSWGTPLSTRSGTLRIETTLGALAELAAA